MHPSPFIEIHPHDAQQLSIQDQDWVEVRSRRGHARFPVTITKAITPGTVFVPIHWGALWADQAEANALTHPESCPDSLQPELKACAVQLVLIAAELVSSEYLRSSHSIQGFLPTRLCLKPTNTVRLSFTHNPSDSYRGIIVLGCH